MSGYEFIITYYIQTKSTNSNHDEFKDSTVVFYIQVQPLLSKYDVEKTGKIQWPFYLQTLHQVSIMKDTGYQTNYMIQN